MFNSFKKFSPSDSEPAQPEPSAPSFGTPDPTPVRPWQPEPAEPAPVSPSAYGKGIQRAQPTRNVLNSDVEVVGALKFQDDLLIDGVVEGEISSEGTLTIGQNARIQAEIKTKAVVIHGKVVGNITVSDRVELKATAELVGDIQAASLSVESGAIFIGRSTVGAPSISASIKGGSSKPAPVKQAVLPVEDTKEKAAGEPGASSTPEMQF